MLLFNELKRRGAIASTGSFKPPFATFPAGKSILASSFHICTLVFCLTLVTPVMAESPKDTDNEGGRFTSELLEEVIVTATRREVPIELVAGSVTALSGDRLEQMGATSFTDYVSAVPGLSFTNAGGFGGQKHVIRGVTTATSSEYRSATAMYFDETPITDGGHSGMTYSPDTMLIDVTRVEVLRGPQGTLFGAGSMGGAIRIISNQPNPFKTEGFAGAALSTVKHGGLGYDLRAMFNTPLADNEAALRIVGFYRDHDGWIDNTTLGQKDINNNRTTGLRLTGCWSGHDSLKITGKIVYQDRKSDGTSIDQGNPNWTQQRATDEPNEDEWTLANLDVEYGFEWADFLSTTSWFDRDVDTRADVTDFFGFSTVTGVNQDDLNEFIQEFRLTSNLNGRFHWLAGLFYQNHDYLFSQNFPAPGFDNATGGMAEMFGHPDNLYTGTTDRNMKQYAVYADLGWSMSDRWEGEIGGRWFNYDHSAYFTADGVFNNGLTEEYMEADEDGFIPRLSLSYAHSENLNMYGLVSAGYRPGGTNEPSGEDHPACKEDLAEIGLDGVPRTFESDSLWNYELGLKTNWADNRVFLNAALYYIDWSDIQTMHFIECGIGFYENAGEATSKGAEFELSVYPVDKLEVTFNGSYTNAKLSEDSINFGAPKGTELPGVPTWILGGSLTMFFNTFEDANTWLRLDFRYVGSSWNAISPDIRFEVPSYSISNARLGYSRGNWEATLFLENLFNKRAIIGVYDNFAGQYVTTLRPLTFGGSIRYSF